jgi:signal transduction histidine kinase
MLAYPSFEVMKEENLDSSKYMPDYPRDFFKKMMEEKGEVMGLEMHWRRFDGKMIFVRENARAITDSRGRILYYEGTLEDITNSKKQQEMIRRRLEYEKVFSGVTARFVKDMDHDESINDSLKDLGLFVGADRVSLFLISRDNNTITNSNEWCREDIKPRKEEMKDLHLSLFSLWMDKIPKDVEIPDITSTDKTQKKWNDLVKDQGISSMVVLPMIQRKKLIGFIGMERTTGGSQWSKDEIELMKVISEVISGSQQKHEAESRLKDEWQRAEFYLDLLNHDMGNINQGLISRVQLFPYVIDDREGLQENIRSMEQLIKRSMDLLKNVKTISNHDPSSTDRTQQDLLKIVEDLKLNLKKKYSGPLEIEIDLSGSKQPQIYADKDFHIVLEKLFDNALKVQTTSEKWMKIGIVADEKDNTTRIEVEDKGPGIHDNMKKDLFQRKMRIGEKMLTGLGLTVVKMIVDSHGWDIWIEDRVDGSPDKGARFVIDTSSF